MKNRDTIVLLLVLTLVGLFLWQLIQNLSKAVETVSTKNATNSDQLSQKLTSVDMAINDVKTVQVVQSDRISTTPVDYLSAYQSALQ